MLLFIRMIGSILVGRRHALLDGESWRILLQRKERYGFRWVANIVDSTQNDDFAEYKRQYEFHADAWLVSRAHGEQGLSRRSAQQMLRALRGMYRFLQIHKR